MAGTYGCVQNLVLNESLLMAGRVWIDLTWAGEHVHLLVKFRLVVERKSDFVYPGIEREVLILDLKEARLGNRNGNSVLDGSDFKLSRRVRVNRE